MDYYQNICYNPHKVKNCVLCSKLINLVFRCNCCDMYKHITDFTHQLIPIEKFEPYEINGGIQRELGHEHFNWLRYITDDGFYFRVQRQCDKCNYGMHFSNMKNKKVSCYLCEKTLGERSYEKHIQTKKHILNKLDWELHGLKRIERLE